MWGPPVARNNIHHLGSSASTVLNSPVGRQAREDIKNALYKALANSSTVNEREEIAGIIRGSEMFWGILEKYERAPSVEERNEVLKGKFF